VNSSDRTWFGDDGKPIGVTMPEVYGPEAETEPPLAQELGNDTRLTEILAHLHDLPIHRKIPALAVVLRFAGIDTASLRESARKAGCSRYDLRREERHFYHLFQR
jgi:hypothetical protein